MKCKSKQEWVFYLLQIIILLTILIPISFAATQFKDLHEIKDTEITSEDSFRHFDAYRFRYDGKECRIEINSIEKDKVNFYFRSSTYGNEHFTLHKYEKKTFDLDEDYMIDFELTLDGTNITSTKKRALLTFSTQAITIENDNEDIKNDTKKEQINSSENKVSENNVSVNNETLEKKNNDVEFVNNSIEIIEKEKTMSSTMFNLIIWIIVFIVLLLIIVVFTALHKHNQI